MTLPPSIQSMIEAESHQAQLEREKALRDGGVVYSINYCDGYEAGYLAAATVILQEPGRYNLAGSWVKASERLPTFGKKLFIKYKGEPVIADTYDEARPDEVPQITFFFRNVTLFKEDYEYIEWLSSTPAAPVDKGVVEVLELAEVELMAMYKRLGFKGSNVLDRITDELKKYGK